MNIGIDFVPREEKGNRRELQPLHAISPRCGQVRPNPRQAAEQEERRETGSGGERVGIRQRRRGCGTARATSVGRGVRLPPSSSPPDPRRA